MFMWCFNFNQDIGLWDVSAVTDMQYMFYEIDYFDQDLGGWNVSSVVHAWAMFSYTNLSVANYDSLLIGWSALTLQMNGDFDGGYSKYSAGAAATARQYIIDTFNWYIEDGGQV